MGDNVLGFWPKGDAGWFQAQVFAVKRSVTKGPTYSLYFPEDGEVYKNAPPKHVKIPPKKENWTKLTREEYCEIEFQHDGANSNGPSSTPNPKGKFMATAIGVKGLEVNKYVCKRILKGRFQDKTKYLFDIGYVQRKLFKHFFPIT